MKSPLTLRARSSAARFLALVALVVVPLGLSGCAVIGDIFKAGVWVGVVVVVGLVVLVGGAMTMMKR